MREGRDGVLEDARTKWCEEGALSLSKETLRPAAFVPSILVRGGNSSFLKECGRLCQAVTRVHVMHVSVWLLGSDRATGVQCSASASCDRCGTTMRRLGTVDKCTMVWEGG